MSAKPIDAADVAAIVQLVIEGSGLISMPDVRPDRFVEISSDRLAGDDWVDFTVWNDGDEEIATGVLRVDMTVQADCLDCSPERLCAEHRQDARDDAAHDAADIERERGDWR